LIAFARLLPSSELGDTRIVRAVALFQDGQRPAIKGLSFCPPVGLFEQVRQISESGDATSASA
jgi:hypothetical protein